MYYYLAELQNILTNMFEKASLLDFIGFNRLFFYVNWHFLTKIGYYTMEHFNYKLYIFKVVFK